MAKHGPGLADEESRVKSPESTRAHANWVAHLRCNFPLDLPRLDACSTSSVRYW